MVLQYPIRLTPTVLGIDPVQLRRDATDPVESSARALANLRPVITDQAAVVEFGAEAMGLARSTLTSATDTTVQEVATNEDNAALLPTEANDIEAFLADAFGPDEANSALIRALDSNVQSAQKKPGAFDPYSGLFDEQPRSLLESGFFRSPYAPTTDSTFPSPLLNNGLESGFPQPLAGNTLESAFPRAAANALDSKFPEVPAGYNLESGFFRSANATSESAFPAASGTRESIFPRAPLVPDSDATLARTALASDSETAFPRVPVANADEALRPPPTTAAETDLTRANDLNSNRAVERQSAELRAEELRAEQRREVQTGASEDRRIRTDELDQRAEARQLEQRETAKQATERYDEARDAAAAERLERQARAQLAAERYAEARETYRRQ
jgi:hypothetical protein